MKQRLAGLILLIPMLLITGCAGEAPTSPSFAYAGKWTGIWIDYSFVNPNTGYPVYCYTLTLNVEKNGTTTGEGVVEVEFIEGLFMDRLKMWITVLPDGSAYGTGTWDARLGNELLGEGEGKVFGQFDNRTGKAAGSLIIVENGLTWHYPWQVSR